ncbi:tyrosine-type recombinase/integrase [Rhodobacteraceae bacterium XHP0102]|nr:tyrosine-type recombinase/integrase [Rhodobacteraceae bacterium XHP0102]
MAGQKLPNLKRGSDGVFRYRRVVPRPYRDFFGKSEHKKVLTADPTLARQLWEKEERWFDQTLSKAKATAKEQDGSFSDVSEQARQFLAREGLLDDQMPKLSPNANAQERQEYLAEVAVWQDRRELYKDLLLEALEFQSLDEEQLKKDYDSGRWGQPDYKTPYKEVTSVEGTALNILHGGEYAQSKATWKTALGLYFSVNASQKGRLKDTQATFEKKTQNMVVRFANFIHPSGLDLALDQTERSKVRSWLGTLPSKSTANRYNNQLSAIINCWNQENPSQTVPNPFTGLSNKKLEQRDSLKRRAFKPDEWNTYIEKLKAHPNAELKLIALIMVYTGCRNAEAAGLLVKDLRLGNTTNIPHIIFKSNRNRLMAKDGLERAVPIATPLLQAIQEYDIPNDPEADLFPKYGAAKGHTNISNQLGKIVRKFVSDDPKLVPYSTRSTLITRLHKAGTSEADAHYLVGHRSPQSNAIHRLHYLKTDPPEQHLMSITAALAETDWGYFYE